MYRRLLTSIHNSHVSAAAAAAAGLWGVQNCKCSHPVKLDGKASSSARGHWVWVPDEVFREASTQKSGCTLGPTAVVQGAAGGMGQEVVRKLFERGVTTIIGVDLRLADEVVRRRLEVFWELDRPDRTFIELSELGDLPEERSAFTVSSAKLKAAVAALQEGVSAVVCVGGGNPPGVHNVSYPAPAEMPMYTFHQHLDFNFCASALTVNACIDGVVAAQGSIVMTSSVNGLTGIGETGYSVSKAALHPYAHNLASHYGPNGVTANAVAFGTVGTNGAWVEALKQDPHILKKIGARIPRGKVGTPSEAADILVFLVSQESKLINGQVLVADGGWTLVAGTVDTAAPGKQWFD